MPERDTGEDSLPPKGPRGIPGGFNGGGPGGPPGGSGGHGFGGLGFSGLDPRQFGGRDNGYGVKRKRYYTPGGDDQIAAVQTGEKIIPANISQSPQYGPELDHLIDMGRSMSSPGPGPQGYCMGGTVRGYADGGEVQPPTDSGSLSPSVRILKLLLELDDCCGPNAATPHFAAGGTVGPTRLTQYMGPGTPRGGFEGSNLGLQPSQPNNYRYNPEGGVTGGYDPNDPYGAYTQNRDTSLVGAGVRQMGAYGNAGAYDPHGDPVMLSRLAELGNQDANAYAGRVYNQADISGLDPAAAASLKLRALASAGQGSADLLNQYRVNHAQGQDAYGKDLAHQLISGNQGTTSQLNEARLNDWMAGNQANRQHKDQWGTLAGGVIGAGAGAYMGGH